MLDDWMQRQRPSSPALEAGWIEFVEGLAAAAGKETDETDSLDGCVNYGKPGRVEVWAGGPHIDFVLNEGEACIEVYLQEAFQPAAREIGRLPVRGCDCNLEGFGSGEWVPSSRAGILIVKQLSGRGDSR